MRRNRLPPPRGAFLLLTALFLVVLIAFAALGLDFGGAMIAKGQAFTASENAGRAALSEIHPPDYVDLGPDPDWSVFVQGQRLSVWSTAEAIASKCEVGSLVPLVARNGSSVGPDSDTLGVHIDRGGIAPHNPGIAANVDNAEDGDIVLLGRNAGAPQSAQVVIRRTPEPAVDGVRSGGNPLPLLFGRGVFWSQKDLGPGEFGNRGIRLEIRTTVSMRPAAALGEGVYFSYQGGTAKAGVMPLALVLTPEIQEWILAANTDPSIAQTVVVENPGETQKPLAYFTAVGAGAALSFLRYDPSGGSPSEPPTPSLAVGHALPPVSVAVTGHFQQLDSAFVHATWVLPLTDISHRTVGFLRVYCVAIEAASRTITLRLAPSAVTRVRSRPAMANEALPSFFVQTAPPGEWPSPLPFGMVCAPATEQYGHVEP